MRITGLGSASIVAAQVLELDGSEGSKKITFEAFAAFLTAGLGAATTSAQGAVELATTAEAITGTDATRAVTVAAMTAAIAQPAARAVSGTTDTIVAGDIGNVVGYSHATGCTVALNSLAASLTAGRAIVLTLQVTHASHTLTVDPGTGSVTIDGSSSNFVAAAGESRVSLISFDGIAFFSGTP